MMVSYTYLDRPGISEVHCEKAAAEAIDLLEFLGAELREAKACKEVELIHYEDGTCSHGAHHNFCHVASV